MHATTWKVINESLSRSTCGNFELRDVFKPSPLGILLPAGKALWWRVKDGGWDRLDEPSDHPLTIGKAQAMIERHRAALAVPA
jgi:hypothetical protein